MKEDVELVLDNDLMFCMWLCKFIWYSVIYDLRKYKLGLYVIYVNEIEYDYFLFFFIFIGIDSELLDEYFDVFLEFDVFGDDDMEVEQEYVYEQVIELLQLYQRFINVLQILELELQILKIIG